jgi:hypothetical protein
VRAVKLCLAIAVILAWAVCDDARAQGPIPAGRGSAVTATSDLKAIPGRPRPLSGRPWRPEPTPEPTPIIWRDNIQDGELPWGFDGLGIQYAGVHVVPDDANGANLSKVPDPAGGPGYALRHYANFDNSARSQAGIYSFVTPELAAQAMSDEGVYVAMEWYFPEVFHADRIHGPWINVWDWHSTGPWGSDRWHTSPGMFLKTDGTMQFYLAWFFGGGGVSQESNVPFPVGRWFDIEMHYKWTSGPATIQVWIDGELAIEQTVPMTCAPTHTVLEMYTKFYGAGLWFPTQSTRYTRNVRFAGSRIWPGAQ